MPLPQSNARLTAVREPGASEDYDRPATAGAVKWTGAARVYVVQTSKRVGTGDKSSVVIDRRVLAPGDLRVAWQQGDRLELEPDGAEPFTGTVQAIEMHRLPNLPAVARLTLEKQ